jgi:PKD repeat protein
LTKRIAAIMMCAVMVLVAAAPLALATHDVLKGAQGPRASAVTWEYEPPSLGIWSGHIVNNGLRSLVVNVYDNTSGVPDQISHQAIHFAKYNAYPVGTMDTAGVIMATGHVYDITVIPNGPKGSSCTVDDVFSLPAPPVAVITIVSVDYLNVAVSGSLSTDSDGSIVSYMWDFGDGLSGTGMDAVHSYATAGDKTITLTVTDNDGLSGSASTLVSLVAPPDDPPVAAFTYVVNADGVTVSVDGSGSSDDNGIVSYAWNWGDGTSSTGMTATHTYSTPPVAAASDVSGKSRAPGPPHPIWGYTFAADGVSPLNGCVVTVTNLATMEAITYTQAADSNIYSIDMSEFQLGYAFDNMLDVTAVKGTSVGTTQAPITDNANGYDQIDVVLLPTGGSATVTITLTVTDTIGQTASVSQQVTIVW